MEGTGSYGAGLARHLRAEGEVVIEVIRPNRQQRRRNGKLSDSTKGRAHQLPIYARVCGSAPHGRCHDDPGDFGNGIPLSAR